MWLKNKYGDKSVTLSILWYGFVICTVKLFLSGMKFTEQVQFSEFTGVDYAAALSAIGAIYQASKVIYNKHQVEMNEVEDK